MRLLETLLLDPARDRAVCIAGAGGKTTLLYLLARAYARAGRAVALTTTTHILHPNEPDFWDCTAGPARLAPGRVTVVGTPAPEGKLAALPGALLARLHSRADALLIEADGSRRLPVKFPNQTEPVLPPFPHRLILVMGLSALGRPLGEVCHRPELACAALGCKPDDPLVPALLARLVAKGYGALHPQVLLNQADTPALLEAGGQTAALLAQEGLGQTAVLSLKQEGFSC